MKLNFHSISGPGGYNQTYGYAVTFENPEKVYTVRDLLQHILKERSDEWGRIEINRHSAWNAAKGFLCEYSKGKVTRINEELWKEQAGKPIRSMKASGGYTAMDYTFFTEDEKLVAAWVKIEELEEELEVARDRIRGLSQMVREKDAELKALKFSRQQIHENDED